MHWQVRQGIIVGSIAVFSVAVFSVTVFSVAGSFPSDFLGLLVSYFFVTIYLFDFLLQLDVIRHRMVHNL
jgi:hypothetical protein